MPIVTIQLVASHESEVPPERIQALADQLGELFGSGPGETWVRVSYLPRTHYAENDTRLEPAVQPTFVEVLKRSLSDETTLATEAQNIAEIVSEHLSRPEENTHVLYLPPGIGRMAFGGNLVRA